MRTPERLKIIIYTSVFSLLLLSACSRGNEVQAQQPTPTSTVTAVEPIATLQANPINPTPTATPLIIIAKSRFGPQDNEAKNKVIPITESPEGNSAKITSMAENVYYKGVFPFAPETAYDKINSIVNLAKLLTPNIQNQLHGMVKDKNDFKSTIYLYSGNNLDPIYRTDSIKIVLSFDKESGLITLQDTTGNGLRPYDSNTLSTISVATIDLQYKIVRFTLEGAKFEGDIDSYGKFIVSATN